jgi:outer membrane protein OmpA-like peptidoglycan-associated protein
MKSFNYEKFKAESGGNDSWGSYSDLFMVLSFVFLMMYVVSSLKSGTTSIQQHLEQQKMTRENNELQAQIKAYNTLKDEALKEETQDEQEVYNELMDKLTLLQEEATEEKNQLRKRAMENEKKAVALNKYQQIIRNIIDANVLAKSKLKVREEIINNKNEVISDLNQDIESKEKEIAENNREISKINKNLAKKIKDLQKTQSFAKLSKKKAMAQIAELKRKSQEQIEKIKEETEEVQAQLAQMNQELNTTNEKLAQTSDQLENKEKENKDLSRNLASTNEKLEKTVGEFQSQIGEMQAAHEARMAKEKADFDAKMNAAKLSAAEKARQLAEFNNQAKEKSAALGREIATLKGDLAEAQAKANARAQLSKDIAKALKNAGVDAEVNPNTGDVTISFGKDFFDSGSADLKDSMQGVLQKFIPKYSETLFKDPKIASKITSVDIVGFASPTYKGKYINPQSLEEEDQKAAKYNLDLSYKRARSIFDYMFDTKTIKYKNQKELLPLVKVTGRSFFSGDKVPEGATPGMSQKEFCSKFDCKQAQKVIIKFNMDDKK